MVASPTWNALNNVAAESCVWSGYAKRLSDYEIPLTVVHFPRHPFKGIAERRGSEDVGLFSTNALYSSMALCFHIGLVPRWSKAQHAHEFYMTLCYKREHWRLTSVLISTPAKIMLMTVCCNISTYREKPWQEGLTPTMISFDEESSRNE